MTPRIFLDIYRHFRESRFHGGEPLEHHSSISKRYPRMERIALPGLEPLPGTLDQALQTRQSATTADASPYPLHAVAQLLGHSMHVTPRGARPYPSGGGYYPIEAYVLAFDTEGFLPGAYHYRPDTHELERLWELSSTSASAYIADEAWHDAPALIILTARPHKAAVKYHDFALMLALMEAGHIMQNFTLVSATLGTGLRPLAGFREHAIAETLDLELEDELPVYVAALLRAAYRTHRGQDRV